MRGQLLIGEQQHRQQQQQQLPQQPQQASAISPTIPTTSSLSWQLSVVSSSSALLFSTSCSARFLNSLQTIHHCPKSSSPVPPPLPPYPSVPHRQHSSKLSEFHKSHSCSVVCTRPSAILDCSRPNSSASHFDSSSVKHSVNFDVISSKIVDIGNEFDYRPYPINHCQNSSSTSRLSLNANQSSHRKCDQLFFSKKGFSTLPPVAKPFSSSSPSSSSLFTMTSSVTSSTLSRQFPPIQLVSTTNQPPLPPSDQKTLTMDSPSPIDCDDPSTSTLTAAVAVSIPSVQQQEHQLINMAEVKGSIFGCSKTNDLATMAANAGGGATATATLYQINASINDPASMATAWNDSGVTITQQSLAHAFADPQLECAYQLYSMRQRHRPLQLLNWLNLLMTFAEIALPVSVCWLHWTTYEAWQMAIASEAANLEQERVRRSSSQSSSTFSSSSPFAFTSSFSFSSSAFSSSPSTISLSSSTSSHVNSIASAQLQLPALEPTIDCPLQSLSHLLLRVLWISSPLWLPSFLLILLVSCWRHFANHYLHYVALVTAGLTLVLSQLPLPRLLQSSWMLADCPPDRWADWPQQQLQVLLQPLQSTTWHLMYCLFVIFVLLPLPLRWSCLCALFACLVDLIGKCFRTPKLNAGFLMEVSFLARP